MLSLLGAVLNLLTINIEGAVGNLLGAYLYLWPLAAVVYVAVDSTAMRMKPLPDWFFPHVQFARLIARWLQEAKVFPAMTETRAKTWASMSPLRIVAVVVCSLLFVVSLTDLPYVAGETERNVDSALIGIGVIGLFLLNKIPDGSPRRLDWRKLKQERLPSGAVGNAELLDLLRESGGQLRRQGSDIRRRGRDNTSRLLRMLAAGEPGALRAALPALNDLDRALEFVNKMVPADTVTPIPEALWKLYPSFTLPQFSDWLMDYDKRYPGQLTFLATSRQELLAQVIRRAQEPTDKDRTTVLRSSSSHTLES